MQARARTAHAVTRRSRSLGLSGPVCTHRKNRAIVSFSTRTTQRKSEAAVAASEMTALRQQLRQKAGAVG